jgi:hypothetical protein
VTFGFFSKGHKIFALEPPKLIILAFPGHWKDYRAWAKERRLEKVQRWFVPYPFIDGLSCLEPSFGSFLVSKEGKWMELGAFLATTPHELGKGQSKWVPINFTWTFPKQVDTALCRRCLEFKPKTAAALFLAAA